MRRKSLRERLEDLHGHPQEAFLRSLNTLVFAYIERTPGMSQAAIARKLSCDRATLSKWLDGTNTISPEMLKALCALMNPTPEERHTLYQHYQGAIFVEAPATSEIQPTTPPEPTLDRTSPALAPSEPSLADALALLATLPTSDDEPIPPADSFAVRSWAFLSSSQRLPFSSVACGF